jgi:coenzyme PQQ synthesis protein D (PqqD)
VTDIVVCMLGADDRESIIDALASAQRFGLPVHVAVRAPRTLFAGRAGVTQHVIDWHDDFAEARNQLLAQVQSRFVLWMDSDEMLYAFPQLDWSMVPGDIYAVRLQAIHHDLPGLCLRLHRHIPEVRWTGRVHEQLRYRDTVLDDLPRVLPGIVILHSGYDDACVLVAKDQRNAVIARQCPSTEQMTAGELLALARHETFRGRFNLILWLKLFRHPEQRQLLSYDRRHGAALMLCSAGYTPPAEQVLRRNPLIAPLQLAMLADAYRRTGVVDTQRLEYLTTMLGRGLFDPQYTVPLTLVGADRQTLLTYVCTMAAEWMEHRDVMTERPPIPVDDQTVYQRSPCVEEETFEDDLILMHTETYKGVTLNVAAAVLWEALAWPQTPEALAALLQEAGPDIPAQEVASHVHTTLAVLLSHGFIEPQPA